MIKIQVSRLLLYLSFLAIVFSNFIEQTVFIDKYDFLSTILNALILASCILLIVKYIIDPHKIKDIILSIIILLIGLVISYSSEGYYVIIPLILLILNMNNISINKIFKIWIIEISLLMIFVAICYKLDIIGEISNGSTRDGVVRYALGYNYSTFSSNYLFHLTIFYLYFRKSAIRYVEIIILLILNIYIYNLTDTRAVFYYVILAIICLLIVKVFKVKKYSDIINKYSMIVTAIVAAVLSWIYGYGIGIVDQLNELLTNRLYLGNRAFGDFNITFFGQKIEWINEQEMFSEQLYNYVDSSYLNILFNYGLVMLIFILVGYYVIAKKNISKNIYYTLMIAFLSLHSMFDPQLIAIMYNPAILLLGYVIFDRDIVLESEKVHHA